MTLIQLNQDRLLYSNKTGKTINFKKDTLFTIFAIHPHNTVIIEYSKDYNGDTFYYGTNLLLHPEDYMNIVKLESTEQFIDKLNEMLNDL